MNDVELYKTENKTKPAVGHFDEVIEARKAAMDLARRQAMRGDAVCGALFALESMAHSAGLEFVATTAQDWRDEDDDDDMGAF